MSPVGIAAASLSLLARLTLLPNDSATRFATCSSTRPSGDGRPGRAGESSVVAVTDRVPGLSASELFLSDPMQSDTPCLDSREDIAAARFRIALLDLSIRDLPRNVDVAPHRLQAVDL